MANKSFSIVFDASMNISQMTSAVKKIQTEFNKLQLGGSFQKSFTSLLVELDSAIKNFETKSGQEITSKKDITEIENATRKIINLYERLKIEAKTLSGISNKELQKFFPEDLEKGLKQVKSYLDEYEKTVEKNNKEIEDKQKQQRQAQEKLNKAQQKDAAKGRQRISASQMRDLKNSQTQLNKQRKKQQETIAQLEEEREKRITSGNMRIKKDGTADKRYGDAASNQKLLDDIQKARVELETLNQQYNQVSDKISGSITEADYNRNLENIQREIKEAQKAVTDFEQEIGSLKASPQSTESFENLRKEVEKLTGLDLSDITQDLDGFERLKQIFDDFQIRKIDELKTKINQLDGAIEVFGQGAADAKRKGQALGDTFTEMSREAQDLARLQDQVLDFFSLSNTIQIFKNAIRDAFETVKELDAVMTETAVVTDFSIGDMWDKLPEYSKEANKLGTSIKSLYEATTLYYQQGLNSDQAMNVGIETMKMARIANMDAAAATEAMTAALRGFNMEINETNATRINDVYSELAAITAADTEQIATAMSKTASIADAANMEFETTAAFLAQIIETTQEAPETAGTAMKTIIARFTEVKELFDEGMLSGKDAEGEEININKIDAALKKVGISLNDFLKGEKGIDDIFLELASKWDTLDLATQRYIATTAAGSRQQSRFLAMMSNYDRTMELVTAANNSAGASQKQFDKTLESLEAKLQRLNNAWQEFTMGLANNEVIKAGVDLLTWLLETINKITGVAGNEGLGGVVTMFARLATVIGALKGGKSIIKGLLSGVVKTGGLTKEQMKMMGTLGMDETGNWVKDISLMNILMNTLNVTTTESGVLFGKLGIEISKSATAFKLAGAAGASSGAAVTIGWLPVVGIIAGIIVVVWALVAAFKAAHAASPEGKLEAAAEAAERAEEKVEALTKEYEELNSSIESLEDKTQSLDELTKGTDEWKKSVAELNAEVLALVEKYPELAQLLKYDKNGVLTLDGKTSDNKTKQDIIGDYENKITNAQIGKYSANYDTAQKEIDKIMAFSGGSFLTTALGSQEEAIDFITKVTNGKVITNDDTFSQEAVDKYGYDLLAGLLGNPEEEGIDYQSVKVITDIGNQLVGWENKKGAYSSEIAQAALNNANIKNEELISSFLTSDQQVEQLQKKFAEQDGRVSLSEREEYAREHGYYYENYRFYTDETKSEEVPVEIQDVETFLAGKQYSSELTNSYKALDGFMEQIKKSENISDEAFKAMVKEKEGRALNKEQYKAFDETDKIQQYWENNKKSLEAIYGTGNEGFKAFSTFVQNQVFFAKEAYTNADKQLETMKINLSKDSKIESVNAGTYSDIIDNIWEVSLVSGNKKAQEITTEIEGFMNKIQDPEDLEKFAQAIGDLDWANVKDVENLSNDLDDLGIASLFGEGEIDALEQKIISLAKAARAFNADELKEAFGKSRSLAEEIRGREDTERTFTEEQMKQLIEGGGAKAGDFVWTGEDEFTYIGGSMDTLAAALDRNTAAQLEEYKKSLEEKAAKAEAWNQAQKEDVTGFGERLFKQVAETGTTAYSKDILRQYASMYGFGEQQILNELSKEQLLDIIKLNWEELGSELQRETAIDENNKFQETYIPTTAYLQSPEYISTEVEAGRLSQQEALSAYQAQAVNQEISSEEVQVLTERLKSLGHAENEAKLAGYELALKIKEQQKIANKSAESFKEYNEELKSAKGDALKTEIATKKMGQALKKAFGIDFSQKEIEENISLFEEWAEGGEDAADKIVEVFGQKYVDLFEKYENLGGKGQEIFNLLTTLPEGVTITADMDTSGLLSSLTFTEQQMKAFSELIAGMEGIAIEWDMVDEQTIGTGEAAGAGTVRSYKIKTLTNTGANTPSGDGGGGGGSGGSEWENPYDKLYNVQENIDRTIREREQIERRYQRLLDRRLATAQELYKTSQAEIDALREQAEYQQKMVAGRQEMLQEEMDENKDLQKYATVDIESGQITIDWDLINSVTDEEEGKKIEEYISKLEELRDSMHEAQDAIEEIDDSIWEIEDRGREEYLDFEERIKEAITENRQREIDTLEEINDSINEANEKLLDSIQSSIDKIRQDRENEKTEEELGEKQRRLAYLEQDTSGANSLEILELQEEIRQGQEDYTDSLIDQKISELQEQNDKAAEQREKQITIMQNQLDWYIESGRIWAEVDELLKDGLNPQGGLIRGSKLEEVMKNGENWTGLSKIGQMEWLMDLETLIAQSMNWQMTKGQLENLHDKLTGQTITFRNANGEMVSGKVDEEGKVVLDDGSYYKDVYQWIDGGYYTTEQEAIRPTPPPAPSKPQSSQSNTESSSGNGKYGYYMAYINGEGFSGNSEAEARQKAENYRTKRRNDISQAYDDEEISKISADAAIAMWKSASISTKFIPYKTGGLADFTGPAWLDGTKARPELVLNQRDTQNFIQLKDILSSIMSRNIPTTHTSTENNGDLSFDIDINVESLQSDYDVEQVASKVKSMIVDNARYRNNNTISLTR